MFKKDFIKIINEEISSFDFLNNNSLLKEEDAINLLNNEDFQKQFICDLLLKKNNIKENVFESRIGGDYDNDEPSKLTLDYSINFEYQYDQTKEPVKFTIQFYSDNINIETYSNVSPGNYMNPSYTDTYYTYIDWNDINVNMFTLDGDEINFTAFIKAPEKIKELFIRENVEDFISNETYNTNYLKKEKFQNISYC